MGFSASLTERVVDGVHLLVDEEARRRGWLVAFADRRGGVSEAPYNWLNLAARVEDVPDHVDENRRRAAAAVGFELESLALARQVHEVDVVEVTTGGMAGSADGLVTRHSGPVAAILTADCAPVVVANDVAIAVLHAGWRGLVAGIAERGVEHIGGAEAAWIGPSIRDCCYEVGPEVVEAFQERDFPVGNGRVDTALAARTALTRLGVESIAAAPNCTYCDLNYFSYRRDGVTGRQGAFAGLGER
ncbi:MAG: polyphenol oxidase family protein [Actinomycetota bacterium]|nr:polyphenol oxidase family protein [Actinomycetota bacterium]